MLPWQFQLLGKNSLLCFILTLYRKMMIMKKHTTQKGKNISFWRYKTYFLSHLLFVKHQMSAKIVMSCIFCRFRYTFISQPAIIILNAISPECNNQHNKELTDIYPVSYAKYLFLVYYTVMWTSLLLNSTTNVSWSISKIQNLPMLLTYISYIICV